MNWLFRGFIVLVIILMIFGIYGYVKDSNACEARGGHPIYTKYNGIICLKQDMLQ